MGKNSLDNLVPFKKGDPKINRKGLKKGTKNIKTILREMLETDISYEGKKVPTAFVIVSELVKKAVSNKSSKVQLEAIRELLDRSIGKPIQGNVNLNSDLLESKDIKDMLGNSFEVVENEDKQ